MKTLYIAVKFDDQVEDRIRQALAEAQRCPDGSGTLASNDDEMWDIEVIDDDEIKFAALANLYSDLTSD